MPEQHEVASRWDREKRAWFCVSCGIEVGRRNCQVCFPTPAKK